MRIYLASDHAGFALKEALKQHLGLQGYTVEDCGPDSFEPGDDYPQYCIPLAQKVAGDSGSFGIIAGFSGQGEAMAANRVAGARAAVYYGGTEETLQLSREHNDANILSLGAHFLSEEEAKHAVLVWLGTSFSQASRHTRRIAELDQPL